MMFIRIELSAQVSSGWTVCVSSSFLDIHSFNPISFPVCIVEAMNYLNKKEKTAPAEPPRPSAEVELLTELRDSLKNS